MRCDVRFKHFKRCPLFPEMEEMLIENVCQQTFLCDTKSPDWGWGLVVVTALRY
jgi:hypothetical protein